MRHAAPSFGCLTLLPFLILLSWASGPALGQGPSLSRSGSQSPVATLLPLPEVEASQMEEAVKGQLARAREALEAELGNPEAEDEAKGDAYGEFGRLALAFRLNEIAVAAFENARILNPQRFDWHYYLGVHYQGQRRLEDAKQAFEAALAIRPEDLPLTLRLGQTAALAGDGTRARDLFAGLLKQGGGPAVALFGLGKILAAEGEAVRAVELFRLALAEQPEAREVRQQLGLAYRELGEMDAAREQLGYRAEASLIFDDPLMESLAVFRSQGRVFQGMLAAQEGRLPEAEAHYRAVVDAEPENAVYRRALASVLHRQGELAAAEGEYAKAVEVDPADAVARLRLADILLERGRGEAEALAQLKEAAALAPDLLEARLALGKVLIRRGDLEDASPHLRAALELSPDALDSHLRLARVLLDLGKTEEATQTLEAARGTFLDSRDQPEILLALGRAYGELGREEEALSLLRQVAAEEETPRLASLASYRIARRLEMAGKRAEAATAYRASLAVNPGFAEAALALAELLASDGRGKQAVAVLASCLEKAEEAIDRARLALRAGTLEQSAESLEAAISFYEQAVAAAPELAEAQFNLGVARAMAGNLGSAAEHLRRAVELDPASPGGYLALERALSAQGKLAEGAEVLRQGWGRLPREAELAHRLARLLATAPDAGLRDGEAALGLVEAALDLSASFSMAETRAMALAAAGRHTEATQWQGRLLEQAEQGGAPPQVLERLRSHLEIYRGGGLVTMATPSSSGGRP